MSFPDPISSMELSPQTGRLVLTSGKTVAFVPAQPSANAGAAQATLASHSLTLPYAPSSASVHPLAQDRFVTGSTSDEWVRVHGMNGEEREVLKGHHGPVHCVAFSPDGEMYASGSGEYTFFALLLHSLHLLFLALRSVRCALCFWCGMGCSASMISLPVSPELQCYAHPGDCIT
jgi:WD40 repeat protein